MTVLPGRDPQPSLVTRDCSVLWSHSSKPAEDGPSPSPLQLSICTAVLARPLEITTTPLVLYIHSTPELYLTQTQKCMGTLCLFLLSFHGSQPSLFPARSCDRSTMASRVTGAESSRGGWDPSGPALWLQKLRPMLNQAMTSLWLTDTAFTDPN